MNLSHLLCDNFSFPLQYIFLVKRGHSDKINFGIDFLI